MLDNDLLDCKIGLIHSHNTMATFFSGTDNSTLISEGMDTCHFLSLIINNKGEYTARITRKATNVTKGTISTSYNTFEESVEKTEEEVTSIEECIEAFDLVIDKATIEEDDLVKEVARRFKEIQQEKRRTATPSLNSNVVPPSYKTPSLFSKSGPTAEEALRSKPVNNANTNSEGPSFNLYKDIHGDWHLPMNLVATLTAQLLYGSVIINTATYTKLNLVEWIKNKMTTAFNSRFTNIVDYKFWMSNYSETIIGKIEETYNINCGKNDLDVAEICAKDICSYLNTLIKSCGSNAYIDIILDTISDYIIIDEDEPADESFNAHSY